MAKLGGQSVQVARSSSKRLVPETQHSLYLAPVGHRLVNVLAMRRICSPEVQQQALRLLHGAPLMIEGRDEGFDGLILTLGTPRMSLFLACMWIVRGPIRSSQLLGSGMGGHRMLHHVDSSPHDFRSNTLN